MALYLSASTAVVGQTVAQSNDFTVHALRRDKDGMLHYTKARSTEDAVFDFHRTDGEEYTDFLQGTEYVTANAGPKALSNDIVKLIFFLKILLFFPIKKLIPKNIVIATTVNP